MKAKERGSEFSEKVMIEEDDFERLLAESNLLLVVGATGSGRGWLAGLIGKYYSFSTVDLTGDVQSNSVRIRIVTFTPTPTSTPTPTPCIIATAAYGSPLAQEVVYMRHVRDDLIGSSGVGRVLVEAWNTFYYFWSPTLASLIAENDWLRSAFRILLIPLVGVMHLTADIFTVLTAINLDLASTVAFTVAALLSIGVYLILPMTALATALKKVNRWAKQVRLKNALLEITSHSL